jgi:hypothetical protein
MAKQPRKAASSAKKAATSKPKKLTKPPTDWVAVLRLGPEGVKKWNKLTSIQRKQVKLAGADLRECDLSGVKLRDVNAIGANFTGTNLTGANLDGTFTKVLFTNANLTGANLETTRAQNADFTDAKLTRADLRDIGLLHANFTRADLTGAKLDNADLHGADLSTATLTEVTWAGACFDVDTKWPAGFVIPGELKWTGRGNDPRLSGRGKNAVATDINGLMTRLHKVIDAKRMQRTLDMLKKGRNQLFYEIEPTMVRGVVRSQRDIDTVYSCVLMQDGTYSCGTADMAQCMGLSNEPCKHLLVLTIGLARAGQLDPVVADKWIVAARTKNPRWNKTVQSHIADSFLKYKGAQAGEIDWRPTETIPEDFYAL